MVIASVSLADRVRQAENKMHVIQRMFKIYPGRGETKRVRAKDGSISHSLLPCLFFSEIELDGTCEETAGN